MTIFLHPFGPAGLTQAKRAFQEGDNTEAAGRCDPRSGGDCRLWGVREPQSISAPALFPSGSALDLLWQVQTPPLLLHMPLKSQTWLPRRLWWGQLPAGDGWSQGTLPLCLERVSCPAPCLLAGRCGPLVMADAPASLLPATDSD